MSPIVHRYAGYAEETEFGESPPPVADFHLDMASATLDAPEETQLVYQGGLRGDRTHRPGFYSPSGNVVYGTDIRTVGWFLKWVLAGYVFTDGGGAGSLNLHEFYNRGDVLPPSFCTRIGKDAFEHGFSGCVANSLSLEVEGEFINATLDVVAQKDFKASLIEIDDLLLPTEYPLVFHELFVSRAGVDVKALVKSLNLEIQANADAEAGRGMGSRHPYRLPTFGKTVAGSMNLWFEDSNELERYWGAAGGPAAGGSVEFPLALTMNAGADGTLLLEGSRTIWTAVQQQPSGKDEIVQTVNYKCFLDDVELADATVVSTEILATLENAEPEMVATS